MKTVWIGLLIPFLGTSLGAGCVFFMRKALSQSVQKALSGFAAGVMVAASIWSLLIPAMEQAADLGSWAFAPAAAGFWLGIGFLLLLDHVIILRRRGRIHRLRAERRLVRELNPICSSLLQAGCFFMR